MFFEEDLKEKRKELADNIKVGISVDGGTRSLDERIVDLAVNKIMLFGYNPTRNGKLVEDPYLDYLADNLCDIAAVSITLSGMAALLYYL